MVLTARRGRICLKIPHSPRGTRFYWAELRIIVDRGRRSERRWFWSPVWQGPLSSLPACRISLQCLLVKVGRNSDLQYGRCNCFPQLGNEVCYQWVRGLRSCIEGPSRVSFMLPFLMVVAQSVWWLEGRDGLLEKPIFDFRQIRTSFSSPQRPDQLWDSHSHLSIHWVPEVKRPEREAYHTSHLVLRSRMLELYLCSPTCLLGIVLSKLSVN
jgi:hypothetical protein